MKNLGKYDETLDVPRKQDVDDVNKKAADNKTAIDTHVSNKQNPHGVTAQQVGADPSGSAQAVRNELNTHKSDKNNPHAVTADQIGAVKKTGDTMTGDLNVGSVKLDATNGYVIGSWLQGKATGHLTTSATKIAIVDAAGWIYYRTPEELKADMNIQAGGVDIKVQAAQPSGQKAGDFWYQVT